MNNAWRITSHTFLAMLEAMLIASLLVVLVSGTAFAGKGGGKGGATTGGGTVTMAMSVDNNGNGTPNWADSVTYAVSTTATTQPYVSTVCKQGRMLVLSTSAGFFAGYSWPSAQVVPLKTDRWTGGAADCTATLYSMNGGTRTNLATLPFHVDG
jgi:hypothetical protein